MTTRPGEYNNNFVRRLQKLDSGLKSSLSRLIYTAKSFSTLLTEIIDPKTKLGRAKKKEFQHPELIRNLENELNEYITSLDLAIDKLHQNVTFKKPAKMPEAKLGIELVNLVGPSKGCQTDKQFEAVWHLKESTAIVKAELQTDKGKQALLEVLEELKAGQIPEDEQLPRNPPGGVSNSLFPQSTSQFVEGESAYGKSSKLGTDASTQAGTFNSKENQKSSQMNSSRDPIQDHENSTILNIRGSGNKADTKMQSQHSDSKAPLSNSKSEIDSTLFDSMPDKRNLPGTPQTNPIQESMHGKPLSEKPTIDRTTTIDQNSFSRIQEPQPLKQGPQNTMAQSVSGAKQPSMSHDYMAVAEGTVTITTNGTPKQIPPNRIKVIKNPFLITDPNFPEYKIEKVCFLEKSGKTVVLGRTNAETITVHIFKNTKDLDSSFDLAGKDIQPVGMECFELVKDVPKDSKDEDKTSDKYLDLQILYYFKETHKGKDRVTFQYILPTAKKFKPIICSNVVLGRHF